MTRMDTYHTVYLVSFSFIFLGLGVADMPSRRPASEVICMNYEASESQAKSVSPVNSQNIQTKFLVSTLTRHRLWVCL